MNPIAYLVLPIALVTVWKRKYAVLFFLASIPFYELRLGFLLGRNFTVPDIAIMTLMVAIGIDILRSEELPETPIDDLSQKYGYGLSTPLVLLLIFGGVCLISVLFGAVLHTNLMGDVPIVHPYESGYARYFAKEPLTFSRFNITQLLLRFFVIAAVFTVVLGLRDVRIGPLVQWVIGSVVFVALGGLAYQFFISTGFTAPIEALIDAGLRIKVSGRYWGIGRMYSFTGEPGYTAVYLLMGLSMATVLAFDSTQRVMPQRRAKIISAFLLFCCIISTATTAYGGLVIYAGVLGALALWKGWVPRHIIGRCLIAGVLVSVAVLVLGLLVPSLGLLSFIAFQLEKMMFAAGSGSIRIKYIVWSLELGATNPMGVGVGSHYGKSLLGSVFAETGIIGLATFGALIGANVWLSMRTQTAVGRSVAFATLVVFGTCALAKGISVLMFPIIWVLLALPVLMSATWRPSRAVRQLQRHQVTSNLQSILLGSFK